MLKYYQYINIRQDEMTQTHWKQNTTKTDTNNSSKLVL